MAASNPRDHGAFAVAAVLLAAGLAACHAHGATGVDHGVTVAFTRSPTNPSAVDLSFQNASPGAVCIDPAPFQAADFVVKTDKGVEPSGAPAAASPGGCVTIAAGGRLSQTVDVGQAHSRYAMQTGSVCYNYAFHGVAAPAWQAAGQVCE